MTAVLAPSQQFDRGPIVRAEELVTPEMAREWLLHNEAQRPLKELVVDRYARDMRKGRWTATDAPLIWDWNGKLRNGQHRLHAIIKSNTPVTFLVSRNVDPAAIKNVDTGVSRTFADILTMDGVENGKTTAAVTRRDLLWYRNVRMMTGGIEVPSHSELAEHFERNPDIGSASKRGQDVARFSKRLVSPAVAGFSYLKFRRIDENQAETFIEQLMLGHNLAAGNPILVLRERLYNSAKIRRVMTFEQQALVFMAWNHWRDDNAALMKLQLPKGGLNDENFPEPL